MALATKTAATTIQPGKANRTGARTASKRSRASTSSRYRNLIWSDAPTTRSATAGASHNQSTVLEGNMAASMSVVSSAAPAKPAVKTRTARWVGAGRLMVVVRSVPAAVPAGPVPAGPVPAGGVELAVPPRSVPAGAVPTGPVELAVPAGAVPTG